MNINYIRTGDFFIPDLKLPEETRPIGKWGRMHRDYLKEHYPIQFNTLVLSGTLWTYLADLNEQAQHRMDTLIKQLKSAEGITAGVHGFWESPRAATVFRFAVIKFTPPLHHSFCNHFRALI